MYNDRTSSDGLIHAVIIDYGLDIKLILLTSASALLLAPSPATQTLGSFERVLDGPHNQNELVKDGPSLPESRASTRNHRRSVYLMFTIPDQCSPSPASTVIVRASAPTGAKV